MGRKAICIFVLIACVCGCSKEGSKEAQAAGDGNGQAAGVESEAVASDSEETAPVSGIAGNNRTMVLELGNGVTMSLVEIPAGKFVMGSPGDEAGRDYDEGPLRGVTISKPFYMCVYEVTQDQYDAVVGSKWNPSRWKGGARPVESTTWEEAMEFCEKLSAKTGKKVTLPTEGQWEYACRAGSRTRYCFGDDEKQLGAYAKYGRGSITSEDRGTAPVGQRKPNRWGLYDMHGNVSEWCSDWYTDLLISTPSKDPNGPSTGEGRVIRGGSWNGPATDCRSAWRAWVKPVRQYGSGLGFRVVVLEVDEKGAAASSDGGRGLAVIPPAEQIWVKCNNPACRVEYQMSKKAFYKFVMENVNPLANFDPPMECEKCGKKSVYRAEKCENCGRIFFLRAAGPGDFADRCPYCKYSAEEEKRKRRLSGQSQP